MTKYSPWQVQPISIYGTHKNYIVYRYKGDKDRPNSIQLATVYADENLAKSYADVLNLKGGEENGN